jgi:hypothetical protein
MSNLPAVIGFVSIATSQFASGFGPDQKLFRISARRAQQLASMIQA